MYILPTPTHLEVVALGGSSEISPDQHLNYALDIREAIELATPQPQRQRQAQQQHRVRGESG